MDIVKIIIITCGGDPNPCEETPDISTFEVATVLHPACEEILAKKCVWVIPKCSDPFISIDSGNTTHCTVSTVNNQYTYSLEDAEHLDIQEHCKYVYHTCLTDTLHYLI